MTANNGIISQPSPYSVNETIDRLAAVLQAKDITIFARIDQQVEAEKIGLSLRPTLGIQLAPPVVGCVAYLGITSGQPDTSAQILLQALILLRLLPWLCQQPFAASYWTFTFGVAFGRTRHDRSDGRVGSAAIHWHTSP